MRIIPFDFDAASNSYRQLYEQSVNGMIPIFSGEKYQTGYGLGSILKAALPVVKQGVKSLGKTAINTGLNIARDSLSGKPFRESIKDNVNSAAGEVITKGITYVTNRNRNKKRKHQTNRVTSSRSSKVKRRRVTKRDIFS